MDACFSLQGKLAVVTGAGQGNGLAIARGLAKAGADIVVVDRNPATTEAAARLINDEGGNAVSRSIDVGDRSACRTLADDLAQNGLLPSILVNNAGILLRGSIEHDKADENWDMTLKVNVTGPYNMVRAFLPALKQSRGTVINLGSIQSFVSTPNSAAYTASKGAVLQLTKALAVELAPLGIRVNAIAPGFIETPMTEVTRTDPEKIKALLARTPLRRVGQPHELAGAVVFLASEAASYVTGVMLPVDGGYLAS